MKLTHAEVYSIQHYVIKFVSDLWQVFFFPLCSGFLHQWHWPPRYSWTIVLCDVNHHNSFIFMILYFKDSLGCIDNNNIELINIYLYHYVTVTTMCLVFHQRLSRCPQQCIKQGKPISSYSLHLATSANVIYDVGVSTSGEPMLVVFTVGVVVSNSAVCIWCSFSLVLID